MGEQDNERRGRRRRVGMIAFVLTPGLLLGGGLWAASAPLQALVKGALPEPCTPVMSRAPLQNTFEVNVLNHGAPQGAASQVAKELPLRDFRAGQVGNDPGISSVNSVGEIRFGPAGLDQALVVQKVLLPEASLAKDYRFGTSIDLVLGKEFAQLAPPQRPLVRRAEVAVNVYNTTYYEGLAKKASQALTDIGFAKGKVGLDPKKTWITDTAVLRHGPDGELGAQLVKQVVPRSHLALDGAIKGTAVDLLIGMKWAGVLDKSKVKAEPAQKPLQRLVVTRPCS